MYMRVTRGHIDPARFDEANALGPELVAAVSRLPGYRS
jgi:hypothetical protein